MHLLLKPSDDRSTPTRPMEMTTKKRNSGSTNQLRVDASRVFNHDPQIGQSLIYHDWHMPSTVRLISEEGVEEVKKFCEV